MRATGGFVNSDPTRYCAFVLGQSQDVDDVESCGKTEPSAFALALRRTTFACAGLPNRRSHAHQASEGWQVGG